MASPTTVFEGRSAIVTGGASGIGKALGTQLRALGAHVVLADIDGDAAEAAAADVSVTAGNPRGSIIGTPLDVRDRDGVHALIHEVAAMRGSLDFLFNNAGISIGGPTEEMPAEYWDRILDVNIGGVVNGVIAAWPVMLAQGSGHIVNTASGAGLVGAPFVAAYSTTKHAVVGLSTALRSEGAAVGVRVSVLCPGMVETPILDKAPPSDLPKRATPTVSGRTYLEAARLSPATADRMAHLALKGVARNRGLIIEPRSLRALWFLWRISPSAVLAASRITARRVRKVMPAGAAP